MGADRIENLAHLIDELFVALELQDTKKCLEMADLLLDIDWSSVDEQERKKVFAATLALEELAKRHMVAAAKAIADKEKAKKYLR